MFFVHFFPSCHLLGAVSSVGCNPGREDDHSGGRQSDHHRARGPASDRPLHEPAAQSREQQGHPGDHNHTRGSAEPQTGQHAARYLSAAATISPLRLNPPRSQQ